MSALKPFYRGDTKKYTLTVSRLDEYGIRHPVSVHGGILFVTFKSDLDVDDTAAEIKASVNCVEPDPANPIGRVSITLTDTDTNVEPGFYFFDFQFKAVDGAIVTILPEPGAEEEDRKVEILKDATRRIV